MNHNFDYTLINTFNHDETMEGQLIASDMNDAIEKIDSFKPEGWVYTNITKEMN